MKKLSFSTLLGLFSILCLSNTQAQVVGELKNNRPVFTVSQDTLILNFAKHLKANSDMDIFISEILIETFDDKSIFYLKFVGKEHVSRIQLELINEKELNTKGTTACTTKRVELINGCLPGESICSSSENECIKTVSTSSMLLP